MSPGKPAQQHVCTKVAVCIVFLSLIETFLYYTLYGRTKWVRAQGPEASVFKIYYLFYVQCIFVFIEVNVMSNI